MDNESALEKGTLENWMKKKKKIQNSRSNTISLVAGSIYFEGLHAQVKQINSKE